MASSALGLQAFQHSSFTVNRKIFALVPQYLIQSNDGAVIGYVKQKMFSLKENIRVFSDETMTLELLHITARSVLDFSASYDVVDTPSGQIVGALRRRGWASLIRDSWIILDPAEQQIGTIKEDSQALALVRRFITNLIPQSFHMYVNENPVAVCRQNWNLFAPKMSVDLSGDAFRALDRRMAVAAVVLLMAIEGRQKSS